LGGKKDIKIDVRIIVATKVNLYNAMKAGKFRDDLFHRLNEFYIDLPPLRERKEDIPVLAEYFLAEANNALSKNIKGFSRRGGEVMEILLSYDWPGNVRELKNLVKRAALLCDSEYILANHLSLNIWSQNNLKLIDSLNLTVSFKDATKEFQRDLIKKALERADGNKIKAAKILQINRKALYRKIRSLDL
jgi:DNA-binding NtrC family response regulator